MDNITERDNDGGQWEMLRHEGKTMPDANIIQANGKKVIPILANTRDVTTVSESYSIAEREQPFAFRHAPRDFPCISLRLCCESDRAIIPDFLNIGSSSNANDTSSLSEGNFPEILAEFRRTKFPFL
jgi:hypothetical protein